MKTGITQNRTAVWKAIKWSCHAPTTVVTLTGDVVNVVAECAGRGQDIDVAVERAARIAAEHNEHAALWAVAEAAAEDASRNSVSVKMSRALAKLAAVREGRGA